MRSAVQKQFEALLARFTTTVMDALAEAARAELARKATVAERRPAKPTTRAKPQTSAKSRAKPTPKPRAKRASPKPIVEERAPSRARTPAQIEAALLRHLHDGVLLLVDDVVSVVGASPEDAGLVHRTLDRLVARGGVGVAGEGPDRMLFASKSAPTPAPTPAPAPAPEPEPEPVPESTPRKAAEAPAQPETPHRFVIRRKKAIAP